MSTLTPNYNLEKPEATDPFGDFRQSYNDNLDIIDANLGGGGGGGGHTIVDENGSDMPAESKLQFTGNVSVTDDNVNGATVVDVLGGGGNVYGAFLDPSRVIYSAFTFDSSAHTWTATEDCILTDNMYPPDGSTVYFIRIDGKQVFAGYSTIEDPFVYVKKGQVVEYRAKSGSTMKAYGILQGTNGIFAPVIYSDNERVIGIWRDNKPLYQKTLVVNNLNLDTSGTAIDITSLGVEMCTPIFGGSFYIVSGVKRGFAKLEYQEPNEVYLYPAVNHSNTTCYVTIQYTKTADVAGSGNWNTDGVPTHHYSTSEQVIGTWVNNKPLYEKSFVFTPTALTTTIDVSSLQIDDLIERKGTFTRNTGSQIQQKSVDYRTESPASNNYGIQCELRDTNLHVSINGYAYTEITQFRITLKYTKTTD